ncbi:XdhC/CoxI family protein [Beijerinckiaceae bacterium]|nr:XdhC/CoxI family protein [Beijerinckiaceae bacterium]
MLETEGDILRKAQEWMEAGRAVALATVVETWGSAPRPVGSHLVIDSQENFLGSVSGGCVEGDVITEALDVIARGGLRMLEFGVADETAWRVGLSCGGRIKVLVQSIEANRADLLAAFNAERALRRACVLATDIASGDQRLIRGADAVSDPLAAILEERLRRGKSGMVQWEGRELFVSVEVPPVRLIVIGAVHVSQMLAPIACLAGFDVIIVDPRNAFATPERFPSVQLIAEWPDVALPPLYLDRYTAVVLLTHDPRIDDQGLAEALRADCFYIGALGSRKTHAKRLERMRGKGFSDAALERIHAPIGLDIGAVSPAEIAVSILGEIIAELRRKHLRAETEKAA